MNMFNAMFNICWVGLREIYVICRYDMNMFNTMFNIHWGGLRENYQEILICFY